MRKSTAISLKELHLDIKKRSNSYRCGKGKISRLQFTIWLKLSKPQFETGLPLGGGLTHVNCVL